MSTSIAALPVYKTTKTTRTQARADRTIFGTTLDSYDKVDKLLHDKKVQSEAQTLFEKRHKKWTTPTPKTQSLRQNAWGLKDFLQAEIGEEYVRGYSRLSTYSDISSVDQESAQEGDPPESEELTGVRDPRLPKTPSLIAHRNKFGVYNVLTVEKDTGNANEEEFNHRPVSLPLKGRTRGIQPRAASALETVGQAPAQNKTFPAAQQRPKTTMSVESRQSSGYGRHSRKSTASSRKSLAVPKFYFPPNARNNIRTASLKITETGAKDLINAGPINKIGLGDTMQYNHESFKLRGVPNAYKDHGDVFSLGQKGYATTTNKEVTGPGGFYRMSTPERTFNERYSRKDGGSVYSMPYEPSITSSRRTYDAQRKEQQKKKEVHPDPTPELLDDVIPANIFHKFGAEEVKRLLEGREKEVKGALYRAKRTNLSHTGMVPPRVEVPELNHPIDPPASYYTNFGQNLKYDKFEGGLHLYIH